MKRFTGNLLACALLVATAGLSPATAAAAAAPSPAGVEHDARRHSDAVFDANEAKLTVTNLGSFGWDPLGPTTGLGFEWPKGSGRGLISTAGLWVGARVAGDTLVTVAEYVPEFAAGPLDASGNPVDPTETDPAHRVYKIRAGDGPSNPDFAQWPVALGAPATPAGQPRVLGDQTLWCVFNDKVAARHTARAGGTAPLGLEVRQTVVGFDRNGPLGRTVFLAYDLHNKGTNTLDEAYVGFWFDVDLGSAGDDLVGCDPALDLGFTYNDDDDDFVYGAHPPALGCAVLQGPIVAGDTLGMTAFGRLLKDATEPTSAIESYWRLAGVLPAVLPGDCGFGPTRFEVSGDPFLESGCLDTQPADRRFMLSTGPFDMAPGDSQHVVMALIVGGRPDYGDRLTNLRLLRQYVLNAREAVRLDFTDVPDFPEVDPGPARYLGRVGAALTFDASGSRDADGPLDAYHWDFGDGNAFTSGTPIVTHQYLTGGLYDARLTITDADGHTISAPTRVDVYQAGAENPSFADATFRGVSDVTYDNRDVSNRRPFQGVPWGGRFFGGGFDTGCRWSGSTVVPTPDELALCAGASVAPDTFETVELRFNGTQSGYRYFRRELASGDAPSVGRGYAYQNRAPVPFVAVGIRGNRATQLEVMFTERQVTNDAGTQTGPQPTSQNNTWMPAADDSGGHEYLQILALPYSLGARPELTQDGLFFAGTLPVLYGGWLRLRSAADVVDPLDRLVVGWGDVGDAGVGSGASWADFDRDGDLDLFIANQDGSDRLLRNDGASGFVEQPLPPPLIVPFTPRAGGDPLPPGSVVQGGPVGGSQGAWADVDNDGDLDLFIVRNGFANELLRNVSGSFVSSTPVAALGNGNGLEASWVDDDRDGDLDLYISNASGGNVLLRNQGGTLVAATPAALAADGRARWADVDGDGDLDVYLVRDVADRLARNDGIGYTDVSSGPISEAGTGRDADFGDYDNDGDPDLILANDEGIRLLRNQGGVFTDANETELNLSGAQSVRWSDFDGDGDLDLWVAASGQRVLMRNDGTIFTDVSTLLPASAASAAAVAPADVDGDGDPDAYLSNIGANQLLRNDTPRVRFLHVGLTGQLSNRFGVGAEVWVVAQGLTQRRQVMPNDPLPLLFGLGGATQVDTIVVRWPSGLVERRVNVPVFSDVTIVEGNASGVTPSRLAFGRVMPNPAARDQVFELLFPTAPATAKLAIYDVAGRRVWQRDLSVSVPGTQFVRWDGRDDDGRELPAAIYFARLSGPLGETSKRVVRIH